MKNKIKFIYFDVGGVVMKDFSATDKWDQMVSEWKMPKKIKIKLTEYFFNEFTKEICVGKKSVEEFLPIVTKEAGIKFSNDYSLNRDFVGRFEKNLGLRKLLRKIKFEYKFGLLTNMYPGTLDLINKNNLLPKNIWKVIIDSSVEKCRKPEKEIYEIAQKRCGFKAEEILFVDNVKENLKVPKEMGWQIFWFDSGDYEKSNKELEEFLG